MGLNISTKVTDNVKETLREIKLWAQVKSPKVIQPALSYTLDWLVPEMMGTGFRVYELSETEISGRIPFHSSNLDKSGQIHQGLVLNAALELFQNELKRQFDRYFVTVLSTDITLSKKHHWNNELILVLGTSPKDLDRWMLKLQKTKSCEVEVECQIFTSEKLKEKGKAFDKVIIKATLESKNLIA